MLIILRCLSHTPVQYGTYPVFFELAVETTFPVSDAATAGFLVMAQVRE